MRIASVKIGANVYRVVSVPEASLEKSAEIDFVRATISIGAEPTARMRAEYLIHEVLHGLIDDAGMDMADDKEEALVSALAPRLNAFMADNPDAVRELLRMLK